MIYLLHITFLKIQNIILSKKYLEHINVLTCKVKNENFIIEKQLRTILIMITSRTVA